MTRLLHLLTDASASKRGKFVTMAIWLVLAIALAAAAPSLASIYSNSVTQDIPSDA